MHSPILANKDTSNILHKHLSAVHSSSSLTMMQRKTYNILLKNAIRNMHEDRIHQLSIKELKDALGWSDNSNTNEELKEKLKELARTQVEWNILDVDNKNKWTASTLLADISIKGSDIFYSYSLSLQGVLSAPNIYAKLNMEVQKLLTNKYALIVWEIICGDLSIKRQDKAVSEWISYDKILKILDLIGTCYEKRYALFRNQVMSIAVSEINEKSDIRVIVEERVEKRVIKSIRFITERKGNDSGQVSSLHEHRLFPRIKELGFPDRVIEKIIKEYSEKDLECAIDFYVHHVNTAKQKVQNPVAFFEKALDKGWIVPKVILAEETKPAICELNQEVMLLNESVDCINLRLSIIDTIGAADYKSWLQRSQFRLFDNQLFIECASRYQLEYLTNNYQYHIEQVVKSYNSNIEGVQIVTNNIGTTCVQV